MRITVKVIPRSKGNSVTCEDGVYIVRTSTVPVDGKANAVVCELLAKHFAVSKSCVDIVRGHTARQKIVDIFM